MIIVFYRAIPSERAHIRPERQQWHFALFLASLERNFQNESKFLNWNNTEQEEEEERGQSRFIEFQINAMNKQWTRVPLGAQMVKIFIQKRARTRARGWFEAHSLAITIQKSDFGGQFKFKLSQTLFWPRASFHLI